CSVLVKNRNRKPQPQRPNHPLQHTAARCRVYLSHDFDTKLCSKARSRQRWLILCLVRCLGISSSASRLLSRSAGSRLRLTFAILVCRQVGRRATTLTEVTIC